MSYPSMTRRKGEGWEASLSQSSSRPVSSQVCRHLEHRHVLLRVCEQRVEREGLHSGLHDGRGRGGQRESCLGHHAVLEVGHEVVEGEVGVSVRYGSKVNLEGGINGGKVRGKREWNQEMEVEATLFCAHPVMVMRVSE